MFRSSRTSTGTFDDPEFGTVHYRRVRGSRYVRVRVTHHGEIRVSLPLSTALDQARTLIDDSRRRLRGAVSAQRVKQPLYHDGDTIGASHTLHFVPGDALHGTVRGQHITVTCPAHVPHTDPAVQEHTRLQVKKALTAQAKAHLPHLVRRVADQFGYHYERLRYSNASGRWGSCSTSGTISLNIALMKLPPELIEYVVLHELVHTQLMNHSDQFWRRVESHIPDYRQRRRGLRKHTPYL